MLDPKLLRSDLAAVTTALARRGFTLDADSIDHGGKLFYKITIEDAVVDANTEPDEEHLFLYF